MKNFIKASIITYALLSLSLLSKGAEWEFDEFMKFQLCYYPSEELLNLKGDKIITTNSIGIGKSFTPDISNINLKAFLGLGFNVKELPDSNSYNFYLKLFYFPSIFKAQKTTSLIIEEYHLNKLSETESISDYLSKNKNLIVKLGYIDKSTREFTEQNPFPGFKIQNDSEFQKTFNRNIPFTSLYSIPAKPKDSRNEDSMASYSAEGNIALHKELIECYKNNLKETSGTDNNFLYFLDSSSDKNIVILKISKKVNVFPNWKELPMPQNPNKIFLSSLALVQRNTYENLSSAEKQFPENAKIDSDEFSKQYKKVNSTILELASVVYLK